MHGIGGGGGMHELAALGAALAWALTGVIGHPAAQRLGAFGFSLYRQIFVSLLLAAMVWALWPAGQVLDARTVWLLALSGFAGIFLGDSFLYLALIRLGPRRTGAIFALNAPMAAVLGRVFLGEALSGPAVAGIALCTLGVAVSVLGRPGRSGTHRFEAISGPVWLGVGVALLAALGQAVGTMLARPVMATGFDPLLATLIRVAVAVLGLGALLAVAPGLRPPRDPGRGILLRVVAVGVLGMGIGMTLLLYALAGENLAIVATLSALSPVMILPVLWLATGARPSATSWAGALTAMAGMALLFAR